MAHQQGGFGVSFGRLLAVAALSLAATACLDGDEIGNDGGTGKSCGSLGQSPCGAGEFCDFPEGASCGRADAPGTCTPIPQGCTKEYAPVCGCDGTTYGNECMANAAGVSAEFSGECKSVPDGGTEPDAGPVSCGGLIGGGCGKGEFCDYPIDAQCGAADQTGVCSIVPDVCPAVFDPVCGCDGKTYGNACEAAHAQTSVVAKGACDDDGGVGSTCGGLLGVQCPKELFCAYAPEAQCGAGDQTGTCQRRPEACIALYDPVCGCDDKTYGNACEAASAGVSVKAEGECKSDGGGVGAFCGGFAGLQCQADLYCNFPPATKCGSGDQGGTCQRKPEVCTQQYAPVCGCDGKTYGNACMAAGSGVSILHDGEC